MVVTTTLAPPARPTPLRSTVGRKQVMAVTGLVMFLFIVGHVAGNMKFFFGAEAFDHYSHWLRSLLTPLLPHGWFLWGMRASLTAAVVLHMWAATSLALQSRHARPVRYVKTTNVQATYASRTMRWGGVIILLFVIFHLLDLSVGTTNPGFVRGEVFRNVQASFDRWYVSAFYILAQAALCLHLYHGVWSMAQTLGANRPKYDLALRRFSQTIAVVIFFGFISLPVAVMVGYNG
jgi:succinate dehydrogenase / fumarate reductase cytochrome b subunit